MQLPEVRAASLHGYVDLATSLGVDAPALIARAGLDIAALATADTWIPALGVTRLLAATAEQTGRADIGLLLSERRRLSTLGPLSVVLREEPDVRSAVGLLLRYERSYNEALHLELTESSGLATLQLRLEIGQPAPVEHSLDLATATLVGILRSFLGTDWQPLAVCFRHREPADLSTHHRLFGDRCTFDHAFDGIVMSSADLDRPNAESDPALRPYARQILGSLRDTRPQTTADQVRERLELLLPMGRASVDQVARTLGVDRRTLHRHLAAHDETFTSMLHHTRGRLAERYLSSSRYSLTEISQRLGFAAPSAFSRWFRQQYDASPRDWQQHRRQE